MAKTKSVGGKEYPASDFLYVGDPNDVSTWSILKSDAGHVRDGMARWDQDKAIPTDKRPEFAAKLARIARRMGIDPTGFEKKYLKSSEHSEQPDFSNGWIEIFRAGDYSAQGKANIGRSDLERVVANYDPQFHEAPVVVGHPKDDAPAYAWVGEVALKGDSLMARERQVDPAFAELRREGRFKKRSAAFYQDADGSVIGLRHVGWLGAQPPAVKGLQDVAFDDHGQNFVEMTLDEEDSMVVDEKTVREQIAAFFAEMFGRKQSGAPANFSEDDVKRIASEAAAAAAKPLQTEIAKLQGDLTSQAAKFSEQQRTAAGSELRQRTDAVVGKLKASGHWIPAFDKMMLPAIFAELAASEKKLEFGEGDQKKQVSVLDAFVEFLEGLPKIVRGGRVVSGAAPAAKAGKTGDPLTDMAMARAADKKITFSEALTQIADETPELTAWGGALPGAV